MTVVVTLRMDEADFTALCISSMQWKQGAENSWMEQADRFEMSGREDVEINWDFRYIFWVGMDWSAVMLARSYLDAIGERYQIMWDMVENPDPSYVILSDYETQSWKSRPERTDGPT